MSETGEPTEPTQPPPEPAELAAAGAPRTVLRRSTEDRVLAGVAGGLGRHFGIDPVLLRIAFVVLLFAGGTGLVLYLLGWLLIPAEREGDVLAPHAPPRTDLGGTPELVGLALIGLGAFLLLRALVPTVFDGRFVWPVVLIAIGVLVLLRGARR